MENEFGYIHFSTTLQSNRNTDIYIRCGYRYECKKNRITIFTFPPSVFWCRSSPARGSPDHLSWWWAILLFILVAPSWPDLSVLGRTRHCMGGLAMSPPPVLTPRRDGHDDNAQDRWWLTASPIAHAPRPARNVQKYCNWEAETEERKQRNQFLIIPLFAGHKICRH